MSIFVENETGWLVNHQRQINSTYTTTLMFDGYRLSNYSAKRTDSIPGRLAGYSVCQFKAVPELFAIHRSYMMDSQFYKCAKTNQTSDVVVKKFDMLHRDPVRESAHECITPSALQVSFKSKVNIHSM